MRAKYGSISYHVISINFKDGYVMLSLNENLTGGFKANLNQIELNNDPKTETANRTGTPDSL